MDSSGVGAAQQPLLEQLRGKIRLKHYSIRTEDAYVDWVRRFILYHGKRHPLEMGAKEVETFLTHLAVQGNVAASTQNQAKSALLFLYRDVLGSELPWLEGVQSAKRPQRLPVVLTEEEVEALLSRMSGATGLVARLLYGSGLRLLEAARLRVKDLDLDRLEILVRDGKGGKDRVTMVPESLREPLRAQLGVARAYTGATCGRGSVRSTCPSRWRASIRTAAKEWMWQYVFPADRVSRDPRSGRGRRHHVDGQTLSAQCAGPPRGRDPQARNPAQLAALCRVPDYAEQDGMCSRGGVAIAHRDAA